MAALVPSPPTRTICPGRVEPFEGAMQLRVPAGRNATIFTPLSSRRELCFNGPTATLSNLPPPPLSPSDFTFPRIGGAKPNALVLEAQAKVCTGPTQTRPLDEDKAFEVLRTILQSANGEIHERVSRAQLGAFFAGMTIRANSFPSKTQWSDGERKAMKHFWPSLIHVLPADVLFIADPEGTLLEGFPSRGATFTGRGPAEMRLVGALREVLHGGHLGFEEVVGLLRDILPLDQSCEGPDNVSESLVAAFLIGQRMNLENDRELKAYCLAFDDELGQLPVADVASLTHYGEPYDGNTRFFRSTLFAAAVRASYGESCLLHGAESMPPKMGLTEEQMLKHMGAFTGLPSVAAAKLLEDEKVGFAYVSQREARPALHSLVYIREHIKKRPPLATTEKVQQFVRATGREAMMAGFYHEGYRDPLLMLMRRRGASSGLVVKGEEGALSLTTKESLTGTSVKGFPLNHCAGFRPSNSIEASSIDRDGVTRETFEMQINPKDFGFQSSSTPRIDRAVEKNVELGLCALKGEKGPAYDRIILNAAVADHLLGCRGASDISEAVERAKEAVDSGRALARLMNYVQASNLWSKKST
ncbi:hypothetical protein GOP47_0002103 [Adiantum capillus-veneris]|uniref:Anthranilate phosphoribosyltransferase n=1 Tax=Adiantum capillus-veneris TaxID=13818 RepID=A0A9D4ZRB2_ADICA|nr:hypothetical protein GOP47_0002103 [Adiantum capillus-veneris]